MKKLLKVCIFLFLINTLLSAGFFYKIYYKDQNGQSVEVESEAMIPACSRGELRIKCMWPSPLLLMFILQHRINYSQCYTKKELELEKFKQSLSCKIIQY